MLHTRIIEGAAWFQVHLRTRRSEIPTEPQLGPGESPRTDFPPTMHTLSDPWGPPLDVPVLVRGRGRFWRGAPQKRAYFLSKPSGDAREHLTEYIGVGLRRVKISARSDNN